MQQKHTTLAPGFPLILASASPRRRAILTELGLRFRVLAPRVREVEHGADARRTVEENCLRKLRWCARRQPAATVIAADTAVEIDGRPLGKPADMAEAHAMLRRLSGRTHRVLTAVGLKRPGCEADMRVVVSSVTFRRLSDTRIAAYFRLVNPLDKAGAYDINDHGELLVADCKGSRTNVMGLPAEVIREWLQGLLGRENRGSG